MEPFTTVCAVAVPLEGANLDTNQLCPSEFNKVSVTDPDYRRILLHHRRFRPDGSENPGFILNREPYRNARILVGERNFGCGSSRETAVYALRSFGFRALVAPSFGDIFFSNCLKNGLLAVVVPQALADDLRRQLGRKVGAPMTVDLAAQTLTAPDGTVHGFAIQPGRKRQLLDGLDDIALTEEHRAEIEAFEARHNRAMPWLQETGHGPST